MSRCQSISALVGVGGVPREREQKMCSRDIYPESYITPRILVYENKNCAAHRYHINRHLKTMFGRHFSHAHYAGGTIWKTCLRLYHPHTFFRLYRSFPDGTHVFQIVPSFRLYPPLRVVKHLQRRGMVFLIREAVDTARLAMLIAPG